LLGQNTATQKPPNRPHWPAVLLTVVFFGGFTIWAGYDALGMISRAWNGMMKP